MRRMTGQKGFTLIELLVAITLSAFLFGVLYQFLAQTAIYSEIMIQRVRANQEARAAFDLIANGGVFDRDADTLIETDDPYTIVTDEAVVGLRGAAGIVGATIEPTGATITRANQRLVLTHNGLTLRTTELNQTIDCVDGADPHPDCLLAGEAIIEGYHSVDPAFDDQATGVPANDRSYQVTRHCDNGAALGVTQEVDITVLDPRMVARQDFDYTAEQITATYGFLFSHNVDCMP
ncbi:MAG: PulJ/GspJ family protein [Gammaproteobacteria bacterium]